MDENEKPDSAKPFRGAIQKAIANSPDRQKLEAALEALEQKQQRRKQARGEPADAEIITGVPRPDPCPEGCQCWRHSPEPPYDAQAEKDRLAKHLEPKGPPQRKPPTPAEPPPPPLPRDWKYVYIQIRGPRDGDAGVIADGQWAVGNGMLWLESAKGEPIGRQQLGPDDDPAAVARRMLRAKHQIKSPSVPGFYDAAINRTLH